ncbi:MAG: single-stranded DNA-binding protein [bacterium]
MANLNKVFLIGNLTRDPEVRYLQSGKALADIRLAINHKYKLATGEEKDETCFVDVVVWGKQGEACGQYLSKGSPLLVEGRLKYDEWEKDGQKHNRLRVVADRTQFIGAPKRGAEYSDSADSPSAGEARPAPVSRGGAKPPASDEAPSVGDEDNLPF